MRTDKSIKNTIKIIEAWLPSKILYERIPGLSVGITHNGKLVYQSGFGFADLEKKIKATAKTQYRVASISKTFTAIAILQLVEKGKLNLDDSVNKHLKWFRLSNKTGDSKNITIRQILTHSSGVFRDGTTPHWADGKFPSVSELKKQFSEKSLILENLTGFKYSNFAFSILGEVIRVVSGLNYDEYVTKNIINKLGMKDTYPDLTGNEKYLATGYGRVIPNEEREAFKHFKTKSFAPATGFISNVPDLARLIKALSLKNKKQNPILGRELKKEMMRPHWRTIEDDWYGFGVDVYKINDKTIVSHSGGFSGFITQYSLDIENDIGVITLSNTLGSSAPAINTGIFKAIYHFMDKGEKYTKSKVKVALSKYAGIYRSKWADLVVVPIEKRLAMFSVGMHFPTKNIVTLEPKNTKEFKTEDDGIFDAIGEAVKFHFDSKGNITGLTKGASPSKKL